MSTSLVKTGDNAPTNSLVPSSHDMMVFHTMAEQAVSSKMYKGIGEKAGVMMIMLAARELGIPPMSALNGGINIIQGKVEISARMMNALIRKAGHQILVKESTEQSCTLIGKRCDTGESLSASFSVAEAQKAGLVKPGGGWMKWPKDMCFARALSRLARQLFSDVIGIGYVEGEISQINEVKPAECEVITPEPEVTIEDEVAMTEEYTALFDQKEKSLALEYLKVVMTHFEWSSIQAMKELMKDKDKLYEKFHIWKRKNNKGEEG
jgi:hypothetical protein